MFVQDTFLYLIVIMQAQINSALWSFISAIPTGFQIARKVAL